MATVMGPFIIDRVNDMLTFSESFFIPAYYDPETNEVFGDVYWEIAATIDGSFVGYDNGYVFESGMAVLSFPLQGDDPNAVRVIDLNFYAYNSFTGDALNTDWTIRSAAYATEDMAIFGAAGRDMIIGGAGDDMLRGQDGDDQVEAGDGDDIVDGGAGADVLFGGAGDDILAGGSGDDTYFLDSPDDIVVERANGGVDTVWTSASWVMGVNVENVTLLAGNTPVDVLGNDLNNTLIGNVGNNYLNGGRGADVLVGGHGDDTYGVDSTLDSVSELYGGGIDTVRSAVSYTLGVDLENLVLTGAGGVTNINGIGNALNNIITGNGGNNTIAGKGGADRLYGGAGADTFDYNAVTESAFSTYDRIYDLEAIDRIDLSGIDANANVAGNQAFVKVAAFSGQAGQMTMTWKATEGYTLLAADVNGDSVADMRIVLYGDHRGFDNFVY